jgi:hypothetical protein
MGNEILNSALLAKAFDALKKSGAIKIVSAVDENGAPHLSAKDSLHCEGDFIVYSEYIESSKTNRAMTKALWFDKKVSVLILTQDNKSYEITAIPVRAIVAGKDFQKYYAAAQKDLGADLSSVWILKPVGVTDKTLQTRIAEELTQRTHFNHLDRLAK